MFCPLCQSEYRDGFTECSDCQVSLVATKAEAQAAPARLWKGDSERFMDRLLTALSAQGIPAHYKETVYAGPRISFLWFSYPKRSTFEYEVWVFRSELQRAQAIRNVTR